MTSEGLTHEAITADHRLLTTITSVASVHTTLFWRYTSAIPATMDDSNVSSNVIERRPERYGVTVPLGKESFSGPWTTCLVNVFVSLPAYLPVLSLYSLLSHAPLFFGAHASSLSCLQ